MSKNNVIFRLVRYDKVVVIAPDPVLVDLVISSDLPILSVTTDIARPDTAPADHSGYGGSGFPVKGALSYPQPGIAPQPSLPDHFTMAA